jgi:hypothetical protein
VLLTSKMCKQFFGTHCIILILLFNIKTDLKERWLERMTWVHVTQDCDQWQTLKNRVMNLHISEKTGNLASWVIISSTIYLLNSWFHYWLQISADCTTQPLSFLSDKLLLTVNDWEGTRINPHWNVSTKLGGAAEMLCIRNQRLG